MTGLAELFARQRLEFPGLRGDLVHLNNAAGSEMPVSAIETMNAYMRSGFTNEGKIFPRLAACAELNRAAHAATAALLGAGPDEVGIQGNTTTALYAVSRALARRLRPGDRICLSEACHESNIAPWLALAEGGIEIDWIPMLPDTHLDYDALDRVIGERTRIVAFGASSNGTGTIHDIERVVSAARRVGAIVSLDAAHYAPHRPIDVAALGVDLLFFSIYKCFGPHIGGFYIRRDLCRELQPYAVEGFGGPGEASRFETGTRFLESYAGWLGAIDYLERLGRAAAPLLGRTPGGRRETLLVAMEAIAAWEAELVAAGDRALRAVPGAVLYAQAADDPRPRLGVWTFNLRGVTPVGLATRLEQAGVEGVLGHNGAIRTMRRVAADFDGIGVRLSIAHYNTHGDLDRAMAAAAGNPWV